MNASIFSFIMMGACGIGLVAIIFVALVRGAIARMLNKIGFFKKEIRLDEHERNIS